MNAKCPPKIAVEAFFLEGLDLLGLKGHVQTCEACGEIGKALQTERNAFLQRYPFSRFLSEIEPRRKSFLQKTFVFFTPRTFGAALAMAGLTGLMLVSIRSAKVPAPLPEFPAAFPTDSDFQVKGGVGLSFYAQPTPQDPIETGRDGMSLPSGTRLQFVYSNTENSYLTLVGVEETGDLTTYFPESGHSSGSVPKGSRLRLPEGLNWEPKSGYERFYALFSQEPVSDNEVKSAVSQLASEGKTVEDAAKLPLPYPQASILIHRKK